MHNFPIVWLAEVLWGANVQLQLRNGFYRPHSMLSVSISVKICGYPQISIRGYISTHLWCW